MFVGTHGFTCCTLDHNPSTHTQTHTHTNAHTRTHKHAFVGTLHAGGAATGSGSQGALALAQRGDEVASGRDSWLWAAVNAGYDTNIGCHVCECMCVCVLRSSLGESWLWAAVNAGYDTNIGCHVCECMCVCVCECVCVLRSSLGETADCGLLCGCRV